MAVRIRNIGCGTLSTGSGFALDDHTLVTNRHVVSDSSTLQLSTYDGRDIAAARGQHGGPGRPGDRAHRRRAAGRPRARGGRPGHRRPGHGRRVPARARAHRDHRAGARRQTDPLNANLGAVLVTDAPVEHGSSGSAVLDSDGRVVGVVYAKDSNGHSFVVPVSTLRSMLDDEASFTPTDALHRLTRSREDPMAAPHFDPATPDERRERHRSPCAACSARRTSATARWSSPSRGSGAGPGPGSGGGEAGVPSAGAEGETARAGGQEGHGGGGGYGVHVKAVGVFVVDETGAHWQPTLDLNRVILGGQLVRAAVLTHVRARVGGQAAPLAGAARGRSSRESTRVATSSTPAERGVDLREDRVEPGAVEAARRARRRPRPPRACPGTASTVTTPRTGVTAATIASRTSASTPLGRDRRAPPLLLRERPDGRPRDEHRRRAAGVDDEHLPALGHRRQRSARDVRRAPAGRPPATRPSSRRDVNTGSAVRPSGACSATMPADASLSTVCSCPSCTTTSSTSSSASTGTSTRVPARASTSAPTVPEPSWSASSAAATAGSAVPSSPANGRRRRQLASRHGRPATSSASGSVNAPA